MRGMISLMVICSVLNVTIAEAKVRPLTERTGARYLGPIEVSTPPPPQKTLILEEVDGEDPKDIEVTVSIVFDGSNGSEESFFMLRGMFGTSRPDPTARDFPFIAALVEWNGTADDPVAKIYGGPTAEKELICHTSVIELRLIRHENCVYVTAVVPLDDGTLQNAVLETLELESLSEFPNAEELNQYFELTVGGSITVLPNRAVLEEILAP